MTLRNRALRALENLLIAATAPPAPENADRTKHAAERLCEAFTAFTERRDGLVERWTPYQPVKFGRAPERKRQDAGLCATPERIEDLAALAELGMPLFRREDRHKETV